MKAASAKPAKPKDSKKATLFRRLNPRLLRRPRYNSNDIK
jgi:hypothetical protein